jgi:DNA-binding transcriptional LysR family regulator
MDTQFLESFVMVAEYGSVAEAARRLDLSAGAVTQRIHALEQEMGAVLVSRSGRNMRVTEAGAAILPRAKNLLRGVLDLRAIANDKGYTGELNLGAIASGLTGILPPILARLAEKCPQITLRIEPGASSDLYRKVAEGILDAAVMVEPPFALPKTCSWTTWREEPLVVLAPRRMKAREPHDIISTEPFIRYDRKQWGGRLAESYMQREALRTKDRYELDSLEAIAVLVDRQLGVSLVPDWAPPWPAGLALCKLALPRAYQKRRVGLLRLRNSPRDRLIQALLGQAAGI